MKRILYFVILICSIFPQFVYSQITTNELPISVQRGRSVITSDNSQDVIMLQIPDMAKVYYEDSVNSYIADKIQRCGVKIPVTYNISEHGKWIELDDGGKLWQLSMKAENAKYLDLTFSKFWIPDGGKFFVFNPNTNETIGAITSKYLLGDRENPHRYSTGIIKGDIITLEYYQPQSVDVMPVIYLSGVFYGYRIKDEKSPVGGFNTSGSCNINVNCSQGNNWQLEKKAVARILVKLNDKEFWCSGALINNTNQDASPLFLTANHCLDGKRDAISNPNVSDWIFYWDYETTCAGSNTEPNVPTTTGAVVVANKNTDADFALLRLIEDPRNINGNYSPYYLGWDATGNCGVKGVSIHHPHGDVKKISIVANTPTSTEYLEDVISNSYNHWRVTWSDGTTEGSSSGAPLFNNAHRVIGQLHGGYASCNNINEADWYGKFSVSWTGNGDTEPRRRLSNWLDSIGTNVLTLDGFSYMNWAIQGPNVVEGSASYTLQSVPAGYTVQWSINNSQISITPSGYQCSISYNQANTSAYANLTATIKKNGNTVTSISKPIQAYMGFSGTYNYGTGIKQINYPNPIWITPGSVVHIYSPNLKNSTVTYSGSVTPTYYLLNTAGGTLDLGLPSINYATIVLNITSSNGHTYNISVIATNNPPQMSVLASNGQLTVSLVSEDCHDAGFMEQASVTGIDSWTLEVYNVVTGEKKCGMNVSDTSCSIPTVGWKPGIYSVRATIGETVLYEKILIK